MPNKFSKENTDFQLLVALVPDIEERIEAMRKGQPDLLKTILRRVDTERGFRPLDFLGGAL